MLDKLFFIIFDNEIIFCDYIHIFPKSIKLCFFTNQIPSLPRLQLQNIQQR